MKESNKIAGKVAAIETMGLVDGPGIRTVVFLQGCPLRCLYCHNPEMQEAASENAKEYTPSQIVDLLKRYKSYYKDSGGVTFSGGEPLLQKDFLIECLKLCKKEKIHTAVDTSGAVCDCAEILDFVDLVILDVKACTAEEFANITGGKIENLHKFLQLCMQKNKKLWIRQVVVPKVNDNKEQIKMLADFLKYIKGIEKIELLPYHTMAKEKYKKLGRNYALENVPDMDEERCKDLENELKQLLKF